MRWSGLVLPLWLGALEDAHLSPDAELFAELSRGQVLNLVEVFAQVGPKSVFRRARDELRIHRTDADQCRPVIRSHPCKITNKFARRIHLDVPAIEAGTEVRNVNDGELLAGVLLGVLFGSEFLPTGKDSLLSLEHHARFNCLHLHSLQSKVLGNEALTSANVNDTVALANEVVPA